MSDDLMKFQIPVVYRYVAIPILLAIITYFGVGMCFDMLEQYELIRKGESFPILRDFSSPLFPLGAVYFWFKYLTVARTVKVNPDSSIDFSRPFKKVRLHRGSHLIIQDGLLFIDVVHGNGVITFTNLMNNLAQVRSALHNLNPDDSDDTNPEEHLAGILKRRARLKTAFLSLGLSLCLIHGSILMIFYWSSS